MSKETKDISQKSEEIIAFEGRIDYEKINQLLIEIESSLNNRNLPKRDTKKIFRITAECLDNVLKHKTDQACFSAHESRSRSDCFLYLMRQGEDIIIETRNYVDQNHVKLLSNRLDYINKLNKTDLKKLHKNVISIGSISNKGGAGLGFIDMINITGSKLQYSFERINDKCSLYTFSIKYKLL